MLSASEWSKNQSNTILFVLVDSNGNEVLGLSNTFVLQLSKAGASFQASAGTKAEISGGWYSYQATINEADTDGPVAIKITHASIIQQNLEYVIGSRIVNAINFTYTLISDTDSLPIEDAEILIYLDSAGTRLVWSGYTDAFGIAKDSNGALPRLAAGPYFFFRYKNGFSFTNPDEEIAS